MPLQCIWSLPNNAIVAWAEVPQTHQLKALVPKQFGLFWGDHLQAVTAEDHCAASCRSFPVVLFAQGQDKASGHLASM